MPNNAEQSTTMNALQLMPNEAMTSVFNEEYLNLVYRRLNVLLVMDRFSDASRVLDDLRILTKVDSISEMDKSLLRETKIYEQARQLSYRHNTAVQKNAQELYNQWNRLIAAPKEANNASGPRQRKFAHKKSGNMSGASPAGGATPPTVPSKSMFIFRGNSQPKNTDSTTRSPARPMNFPSSPSSRSSTRATIANQPGIGTCLFGQNNPGAGPTTVIQPSTIDPSGHTLPTGGMTMTMTPASQPRTGDGIPPTSKVASSMGTPFAWKDPPNYDGNPFSIPDVFSQPRPGSDLHTNHLPFKTPPKDDMQLSTNLHVSSQPTILAKAALNEEASKVHTAIKTFEELFDWIQQFFERDHFSLFKLKASVKNLQGFVRHFAQELIEMVETNNELRTKAALLKLDLERLDIDKEKAEKNAAAGEKPYDEAAYKELCAKHDACRIRLEGIDADAKKGKQEIQRLKDKFKQRAVEPLQRELAAIEKAKADIERKFENLIMGKFNSFFSFRTCYFQGLQPLFIHRIQSTLLASTCLSMA